MLTLMVGLALTYSHRALSRSQLPQAEYFNPRVAPRAHLSLCSATRSATKLRSHACSSAAARLLS